MQPRFLAPLCTLVSVVALGLLAGCRSATPSSSPAPTAAPGTWKPKSADAQHRLEGFRAFLRRSYPGLGLESKNELWDTTLEYVQWLGVEPDSQAGTARIEGILSSLVPAPNETTSHWLLKGTLQSPSPQSAPAPSTFYGVAALNQTNGQLTLTVDSPQGNLAFRGEEQGGHVQGQLTLQSGANCFSGKAQGTLAPGRISLTVRGRSDKQVLTGEFVLLR